MQIVNERAVRRRWTSCARGITTALSLGALLGSPISCRAWQAGLQTPSAAAGAAVLATPLKPLPAGTSVVNMDSGSTLQLLGSTDAGTLSTVSVTGEPFTSAIRVETLRRPTNDWDFEVGTWSNAAVNKGDVLLATFYVRAIKGQAETGEAHAILDFQTGGPDWAKSTSENVGIPKGWKRYDIPFIARYDTPAGKALAAFRLGYNPQIIELGGFTVTNYGPGVDIASLPRTRTSYEGEEPDAPWRKAAEARIEKIRKGNLVVKVIGTDGKPVSGVTVSLRMTRHAFGFGSTVASDMLLQPGADGDKYRQIIQDNYSRASIENHLKWDAWESWGKGDGMKSVDWLDEHGIPVHGHCLVWGGWSTLPADLAGLKSDHAALKKRIDDHITEEATALRGKLLQWDVINEPYSKHDLTDILGRDAMVEWMKRAHSADPGAQLFVNDYPPLDGAATADDHLNAFYNTLQYLQENGAPLQGIGFQCHFGSDIVPPARVISGLDRFSKFGVPIAITEFDMDTSDEDLQARYMRDFLTAAFSHPSVESIIMWGFWEGRHWLPNAALYRKDWSIKPNGQIWQDLVKKTWWTNADGATDTHGVYTARGFYGDYTLTLTAPGSAPKVVPLHLTRTKTGTTVAIERL